MPDLAALKTAARAAIVMPAAFAFATQVVGKPQTSIFAAFGSFAMLVLVEFGGRPRTRLLAYVGLACAGTVFVSLGTLCSRNPWLAAGATAAVGFVILFSGVFNGYFAAGATSAIVTFVLPVTLPASPSAIPDRLEGWGIASGAGICAVMLLWPPHRRESLRREAAGAFRAVAALMKPDGEAWADRVRAAKEATAELRRRSLGAQHRPTGPTAPTAALASLPDELDWLASFLAPSPDSSAPAIACAEDAEALAAAAAALEASADQLEHRNGTPDLARLDAARDAVAAALVRRLPELPADTPDDLVMDALEPPFRIRVATYSVRQLASYALQATGVDVPELDPDARARRPHRSRLVAAERLVVEHARVGSVWFQNSARGAAGLAIAVFIAQRTGVQHGFWVVLGTLSVLRSNALGTGWSILSALAGTAVGIVLGALILTGIGSHDTSLLWGVLPVAVLVASYAPRAISFAAGQAGFTVVLIILYNLIQPIGWRVGVVRVEDVAIGFAISLGVGILFWPRGAGALLRTNLAAAYAQSVDHVVTTARQLYDRRDPAAAARTARSADGALHRLEDDFQQYLAERSATRDNVEDVAALIAGASRVNRAAYSLELLGRMADGESRLERCGPNLDGELHALQSWYVTFGYTLLNRGPVPPPHIRDSEGHSRLLACVRDAARAGDEKAIRGGLVLLWASQHLDDLWRLEAHVGEHARGGEAAQTGLLGRLGLAAS